MAKTRGGSKRQGGRGNGRRGGGGNGRGGFFRTETKVWRDPALVAAGGDVSALEARTPVEAEVTAAPAPKRAVRIVAAPTPTVDPLELERQRLLARLLAAEGRPTITAAVDDYLARSFELPRTQSVWLQVLEHRDETKVALALETLHAILGESALERRAVLESRLRRIEELAAEPATRVSAAELRRFIQAKGGETEGGRRGVDA